MPLPRTTLRRRARQARPIALARAARPGALGLAIVALCIIAAIATLECIRQAWTAGLANVPEFESAAATVQFLAQLGCAVATLFWLPKSLTRVRDAGAQGMSVGPVGGALWWFVPLANLAMPAKAVGELRKAAIKPRDWEAVSGSWKVRLWWAFWLTAGIANAVFLRASVSEDGDLLAIAGTASFVGDLLTVPAASLFAAVVWSIDADLQALPRTQPHHGAGARTI